MVTSQPAPKDEVLPSENDPRGLTGTITDWVADKGFGFVKNDAGGDYLFVHINDLYERPNESDDDIDLRDQRVAFDTVPEPGKMKDRAVNVVFVIGNPIMRPQPRRETQGSEVTQAGARMVRGIIITLDDDTTSGTIRLNGFDIVITFNEEDFGDRVSYWDLGIGDNFYVDVMYVDGQPKTSNWMY
ncbi:MAG: cold shock domain-containing protein [Candidatus Berkelbacteria bacterium]